MREIAPPDPALILVAGDAVKANDHFATGYDALQAGQFDKAIAEFLTGIALKEDARAEFYLAQAYARNGDKDSAMARYRRSVKLDPKGPVADEARAALDALKTAKEEPRAPAVPDAARGDVGRGDVGRGDAGKSDAGKGDGASGAAETGDADRANGHFTAGYDALMVDDLEQATIEFLAGLSVREDAKAEFYLGRVYERRGDTAAALRRYDRSEHLDADGAVGRQARAAADALRHGDAPTPGGMKTATVAPPAAAPDPTPAPPPRPKLPDVLNGTWCGGTIPSTWTVNGMTLATRTAGAFASTPMGFLGNIGLGIFGDRQPIVLIGDDQFALGSQEGSRPLNVWKLVDADHVEVVDGYGKGDKFHRCSE